MLADAATDRSIWPVRHVVPLRAREGGVLRRPGHTEAAVDLTRLAGLRPAGVLCELVNDDGTMMRLPDLEKFCAEHALTLVTIADLVAYRRRTEKQVELVADARMPTEHGVFRALGYRSEHDSAEHVALVMGDIGDGQDVLVRVHSECLTGDVFGSVRCDCGPQLNAALARVAREGRGVVLYVRGHEAGASAAAQASGVPAPGPRRDTGTPTSTWACRPTHATTAPAPRSSTTWVSARCGCSPTTRPSGPVGGVRPDHHRSEGVPVRPHRRTCATCAPSGTGWVTCWTSWTR